MNSQINKFKKSALGLTARLSFVLCLSSCLFALAGCVSVSIDHPERPPQPMPVLELDDTDRIMILAPHPDDEILAAGGLIQTAVTRGLPVKIVFLTYGDNNCFSFSLYRKRPVVIPSAVRRMGEVRKKEASKAAEILGLTKENLVFLGYPDFGTLKILENHWGNTPPFRSMFTRVRQVSYDSAYRPGAIYSGEEILTDLEKLLLDFEPTIVLTSHPADSNPDHRSLYVFTHVALWNLQNTIQPRILPYLVHYKKWPLTRGYKPHLPLMPPEDLRHTADWLTFPLTAEMIKKKQKALQAHASQYTYSARFLTTFACKTELFGDFPPVSLLNHALPVTLEEDLLEDEVPESLEPAEREHFLDIEKLSANIENETLNIIVKFRRPFTGLSQASLYCFGYRSDTSFSEMPKLQVKLGAAFRRNLDGIDFLPRSAIAIERHARWFTIKIPLKVAGNPEKIFVCAQTYLPKISLDRTAWRILEF